MRIETEKSDVVVIGGGAAGLSAALWCDELGLSARIVERSAEFGGQLLRVYNPIENHLGASAADGRQMRDIFLKQIENRKFSRKLNDGVRSADLLNKIIVLESGENLAARFIVIATGVRRRKLHVEGEDRFAGRGIIESGKRDAEKVRGAQILIVGGGDAAIENALITAETAAKVYVLHRRRKFTARREFLDPARRHPKIEFLPAAAVRKISGGDALNAVEIYDAAADQSKILPIGALLIRIGVEPNSELFSGALPLNKNGYIMTDACGETALSGIYAVGDVANPLSPTVSTAVGTGATAAKAIFSRINL